MSLVTQYFSLYNYLYPILVINLTSGLSCFAETRKKTKQKPLCPDSHRCTGQRSHSGSEICCAQLVPVCHSLAHAGLIMPKWLPGSGLCWTVKVGGGGDCRAVLPYWAPWPEEWNQLLRNKRSMSCLNVSRGTTEIQTSHSLGPFVKLFWMHYCCDSFFC